MGSTEREVLNLGVWWMERERERMEGFGPAGGAAIIMCGHE